MHTLVQTSTSPFLKMSFETTCTFLTEATVAADVDRMKSPSSRISLGAVVGCGTGAFEVTWPPSIPQFNFNNEATTAPPLHMLCVHAHMSKQ